MLPGEWGDAVVSSLQHIRSARLERELRPLLPTSNAVEALLHPDERSAWLDDVASPGCGADVPLNTATLSQADRTAAHLSPLLLFSLNDYLGLSTHPDVRAAAAAAAAQAGCGPRSSALVGGFTTEHRALERELAALKGAEDALLFPSGFAANVAVVTVLAAAGAAAMPQKQQQQQQSHRQQHPQLLLDDEPAVIIFSDELNHASLVDGARLASRANGGGVVLRVFRHADLGHLEQLLRGAPPQARKLVLTDSLFSMDGDWADLQGLAALRARWGFLLVVDEAHASLVAGPRGGGGADAARACSAVDVSVGTLSKAAGAHGGFVACSSALRALLLNRGRSLVYSTALPLPAVAAARAALRVAACERWRQQHLVRLAKLLSSRLGVAAASPIIPLVVGDEAAALSLSRELLAAGFHVPAIRPPTVPPGTCRLRVSLSAAHTAAQVAALADAVTAALKKLPGVSLAKLPYLTTRWQAAYWLEPAPVALPHASNSSGDDRGGHPAARL